jgi:hypothetical protein
VAAQGLIELPELLVEVLSAVREQGLVVQIAERASIGRTAVHTECADAPNAIVGKDIQRCLRAEELDRSDGLARKRGKVAAG